jgi:hypothetical protein
MHHELDRYRTGTGTATQITACSRCRTWIGGVAEGTETVNDAPDGHQ